MENKKMKENEINAIAVLEAIRGDKTARDYLEQKEIRSMKKAGLVGAEIVESTVRKPCFFCGTMKRHICATDSEW